MITLIVSVILALCPISPAADTRPGAPQREAHALIRRSGKSHARKWEDGNPSLLVMAMVSTKDNLFVAGPKDIMDEKNYSFSDAAKGYEQHKSDLKRQADIWNGRVGGLLHAVSKKDGKRISEHRLDAIPVFDGMIAVEGRLFVSLTSGDLICLGGG